MRASSHRCRWTKGAVGFILQRLVLGLRGNQGVERLVPVSPGLRLDHGTGAAAEHFCPVSAQAKCPPLDLRLSSHVSTVGGGCLLGEGPAQGLSEQ